MLYEERNNCNPHTYPVCGNNDDDTDDEVEIKVDGREADDVGVIAVANAPYNIHCLTVIGQIVSVDS